MVFKACSIGEMLFTERDQSDSANPGNNIVSLTSLYKERLSQSVHHDFFYQSAILYHESNYFRCVISHTDAELAFF